MAAGPRSGTLGDALHSPGCPGAVGRGEQHGIHRATGSALTGYLVVFSIEGLLLLIAAIMLSRIDVNAFRKQAHEPSFVDKVALAAE